MSYIPPKEWQRLLKRVFAIDADRRLLIGIDLDNVGLAKDATLTSTLSRNVAQWGGATQTGFDFEDHIPYTGAHRFKTEFHSSGATTVAAATIVTTLSVTGIGRIPTTQWRHRSVGVAPGKAHLLLNIDAEGLMWDFCPWSVALCQVRGLNSVGWHLNKLYVETWDTVNNDYMVNMPYARPNMFRSSVDVAFRNYDTAIDATMYTRLVYAIFSSSKRILVKLPRWIDALALRKKSGIARLKGCPISVVRLGYFEDEEEHPYRDWLDDLPNKWDDERVLPDGRRIRSATEKVQNFVAEIYAPEEMTVDQALGEIKPLKVLYEEVV